MVVNKNSELSNKMQKKHLETIALVYIVWIQTVSFSFALLHRVTNRQEGIFHRRFHHMKFVDWNTPIAVLQVYNLYDCANECMKNSDCKAFHLDMGPPANELRTCELLKLGGEAAFWSFFKPATNFSYFDTDREYYKLN